MSRTFQAEKEKGRYQPLLLLCEEEDNRVQYTCIYHMCILLRYMLTRYELLIRYTSEVVLATSHPLQAQAPVRIYYFV